jgi:outer membrane protein assembly factor BamB
MIKALKLLWVVLVLAMIIGKPPEAGASSDVVVKWEYEASSDIQWLDHWEDGFSTGDLNGDGIPDVVFGTSSGQVVALDGSNGGELWPPVAIPDTIGPVNADITNLDGGAMDIVAGGKATSGTVNIIALNNDGSQKWTSPGKYQEVTDFAYGDIDGDGDIDVVASIGIYPWGGGQVLLLDGKTGQEVWNLSWETGIAYAVDAMDINNDGDMEVAVTSYDDKVFLIDGSTKDIVWESERGRYHGWDVDIEDLDDDGIFEILAVMGYLYCYGADGTLKWSARDVERLESGDVDGTDEGKKEVVASASGKTYVFDGTSGEELWSREGGLFDIGDVNGDGVDDIVIGSTGANVITHYVVAVDGSGDLIWQYDLDAEPSAVVAANIDEDASKEVLVAMGARLVAIDAYEEIDTTPPVIISGPEILNITSTAAMVTWVTDESSSSVVEYGTTSAYGLTAQGPPDGVLHPISLSSLSPDTTYYYRVGSTDLLGNTVWSDEQTFSTLAEDVGRLLSITSAEAAPGTSTTVYVSITDATDMAGSDITVRYDTGILAIGEVTGTDLVSSLNPNFNTDIPGEIIIGMAGSNGISSGSGDLVEIELKVNVDAQAGTETPLNFEEARIYNETGNVIPTSAENGVVKITQPGIKGDVNNDGKVRSNDAILALRIATGLMSPDESQKWAADMNDDGRIRSNDAILILRKATGLSVTGNNE